MFCLVYGANLCIASYILSANVLAEPLIIMIVSDIFTSDGTLDNLNEQMVVAYRDLLVILSSFKLLRLATVKRRNARLSH